MCVEYCREWLPVIRKSPVFHYTRNFQREFALQRPLTCTDTENWWRKHLYSLQAFPCVRFGVGSVIYESGEAICPDSYLGELMEILSRKEWYFYLHRVLRQQLRSLTFLCALTKEITEVRLICTISVKMWVKVT